MNIERDGKGQPYIEWAQAPRGYKRAWIQRKTERNWADAERYLNVVRSDDAGHPGGNPTDFPIFNNQLSDEQILRAFVHSVCAITGCALPSEGNVA